MRQATGAELKMWGEGIVEFGEYRYKYRSGREGDWPLTGLGPRKQNLTVYMMCGLDRSPALLAKLGKFQTGKGCRYFKRLSNLDTRTLKVLVNQSVDQLRNTYK